MASLFKAIATLLFLAVMASLVSDKVAALFPDIDTTGWIILVTGGGIVIWLTISVEPLVMRFGLGWLNRSEELRQYVIIFALFLLIALLLYLTWPLAGGFLSPHFGHIH